MRHILSDLLFIYGFLAILIGIIDCDGIFFLGLFCCLMAWLIYPKERRQKDDGGKSLRDNRTWED